MNQKTLFALIFLAVLFIVIKGGKDQENEEQSGTSGETPKMGGAKPGANTPANMRQKDVVKYKKGANV